jgi:hypothetical protein
MKDIQFNSINLPSLSIYNNIIGFHNKFQKFIKSKNYNTFISREIVLNNVIDEIDGICQFINKRVKSKDVYEVHFIKPNKKFFVDIGDIYNDLVKEYDEENTISINIFKELDCGIIDLRNTQYQYFIHKIENDYYLLEFCINFLVYTDNEDKDIYNNLSLPFLNGISNFGILMDDYDNFNSIFTLKVYKIPKTIKLPTIENYLINKYDRKELIKFYKITSHFVKQIKSNYNRKKYKKISDENLINLFSNKNLKKNKKKIKKSFKNNEDLNEKSLETTERLLKNTERLLKNTENTENTEKNFKNNFKTEKILKNSLKTEKTFKLPFILKFKYKDIEINRKIYERLFTDLFKTNKRFSQFIELDGVKEIFIYKCFSKKYNNSLYFNGSIFQTNYHFYIKNNRISSMTFISNII